MAILHISLKHLCELSKVVRSMRVLYMCLCVHACNMILSVTLCSFLHICLFL